MEVGAGGWGRGIEYPTSDYFLAQLSRLSLIPAANIDDFSTYTVLSDLIISYLTD